MLPEVAELLVGYSRYGMTLNKPPPCRKEQSASHLRIAQRGRVAARKLIDRGVGKRQTELERVLSAPSLGLSHELPSDLFRHPARSPKGYDCNGLGHIVLTSSVRASLMKTLLKQWPKMLTSLSTFQKNRQGNLVKIALPSVVCAAVILCYKKGVVARCGPHQKMLLFVLWEFKCQYRAAAWHCFRHQAPQMLGGSAVIKEPITNEIDEPVKLIIRERRRLRHERVNAGQDWPNRPHRASQVGSDSCGGGVIIIRRRTNV